MLNIHVVTPARGGIRPELALFRESLAVNERRFLLTMNYSDAQPVANNRNQITSRFLERGGDFLLMIDSDVCPLFNPLDYVENNLDVVGFPTPTWRGSHVVPLVWYPCPPDRRGLIEVDWLTTSCILVARRVLEKLRAPFMDEWDDDGMRTYGEDQSFCLRARAEGFRVWCDTQQACAHFKTLDLVTVWRYVHGIPKSSL